MKIKKHLFSLLLTLLPVMSTSAQTSKGPAWLSNAVFYQIYPSSYMDTDGNGIGDLPGITSKLDYIKSLGVNAIWMNPIFVSGWFDGGYDVIDFYKVDPRFGTNDDLVTLVREAHKRGMKVILDLVAGHSSSKSEWFRLSATGGRNDRYADYYIWSDSISEKDKQDIALRNQEPDPEVSKRGLWVEADARRGKYYQKNYYICQPALNYGYAHPDPSHPWEQAMDAPGPMAVRRELKNIMAFWYDKGVDGFRVDMAASLVKGDPDKKGVMALWHDMKEWQSKNYPQCILVSEWSNPVQSLNAGFNIDFEIHLATKVYNTLFFASDDPWGKKGKECYFDERGRGSLKYFMDTYGEAYRETADKGYITFPTANHDFQRLRTGRRNSLSQLKVAMTFCLTMPGVPFIYYGDEIGMRYQPGLKPKEGSRERSGTRTPMQWTKGHNAGFSTCPADSLYFPVNTEGGSISVEAENKDSHSMLNFVRSVLHLRKSSKALGNDGSWTLVSDVNKPYPMIYKRSYGNETYVVALNPAARKVSADISHIGKGKALMVSGKADYKTGKATDTVNLGATSAAIFRIK